MKIHETGQSFSILTGEFSNPVTEALFRRANWSQTRLQLRIIYGICLVGYLAVIIPDYLAIGLSPEWMIMASTRLLVSASFLAVLLETLRRKPGKWLPLVIFVAQAGFAIGEILLVEISLQAGLVENAPSLPFVLIAIFIYFAFTENRLMVTLVAALFSGMGGVLHMATLVPDSADYALRYSIICIGIILFTFLFMRMLYRSRRQQWLNASALAIENQVRHRREQQLAALNRQKDVFLQVLNHEMRTPLYGMLGILESVTPHDRQDTEDKLRTVLGSGKVLMQLINDVLDIAGNDTRQRPCDQHDSFSLRRLLATIREVMANYHHATPDQLRLIIDPSLPDRMHADETRLQQILYNLVSNAMKYGNGRPVTLSAQHQQTSGDKTWITLAIEDQGQGIAEPFRHQIFDAFSRSNDASHGIEGLGLGLYISKRVAALIDAQLDYAPAASGGSVFSLTFPVALDINPDFDDSLQTARLAALPRRKILVVDDAAIARTASKALLERLGQDVITAESEQTALEQCQQHQPDLVFMDLSLGDVSGFDAARSLRRQGYGGDIVALTAYSTDNIPSPSPDGLFRHIFDKPLALNALLTYLGADQPTAPPSNDQVNDLPPVIDQRFVDQEIDLLGADYWQETVATFKDHATTCLAEMHTTFGNTRILRQKAHFLAGLAANTGLSRLNFHCRDYERRIAGLDPDNIALALDHLHTELQDAIAAHEHTLARI